jgi:hypothetical protein
VVLEILGVSEHPLEIMQDISDTDRCTGASNWGLVAPAERKDGQMLRMFCFDRLGVVIEDLYFVDPDPAPGEDGPERGVRVELRLVEPQPWRGSIYAAQRVVVDRAVFRVDLLESVAAGPGSNDRMHHHPAMRDSEPGERVYDPGLTDDPTGWLATRLADVVPLLEAAEVPDVARFRRAADELRDALPEIMGTVTTTLAEVRAGRLAREPVGADGPAGAGRRSPTPRS